MSTPKKASHPPKAVPKAVPAADPVGADENEDADVPSPPPGPPAEEASVEPESLPVGAADDGAGGPPSAAFGSGDGPVTRLFKRRVLKKLMENGVPKAKAEEALRGFGDGQIIQWILANKGDVAAFVKLLLDLLV